MGTPPSSPVPDSWPTPSQYRDWFLMLLREEQLTEAARIVDDRERLMYGPILRDGPPWR